MLHTELPNSSMLLLLHSTSKCLRLKLRRRSAKIGFAKAMGRKWVQICGEKKEKVKRISAELIDDEQLLL